jgi:hypothetical protein
LYPALLFTGAYVLGSTLNAVKKQIKATPRTQSASHEIMDMIKEISVSSRAPSIPSRGRCYGYEVGATGKLVPQESSLAGHKGTKGDTVGPGNYNPDDAYITKNKNSSSFPVLFDNSALNLAVGSSSIL